MLDASDLAEIRRIFAEMALPPEFVDADGLALMLAMSRSSVYRANDAGLIPAPVQIDVRGCRWRVREIRSWSDSGCPVRPIWETMKQGAMKRAG